MKYKIGDKAPLFSGVDQNGNLFNSDKLLGSKNIVVYFYPKNETKVCTAQACSFRDSYEEFKDFDCEVIGISGDGEKSHSSFATNHNLPYILLSDKNKAHRKAFDVPKALLGLLPGRYTFVINKEGEFIEIFHDMSRAQIHIDKAIIALKATQK